MRTMSSDRWIGLLAAVLLTTLVGCGDDAPPIGYVSGTVTRGGEPIPNLMVNFMPAEGRPSWGLTDDNGKYKLNWDADHDGAEIGTHKVFVAYVPISMEEEISQAKPSKRTAKPAQDVVGIVTNQYGYEKTPLSLEVKKGSQTIDLALD